MHPSTPYKTSPPSFTVEIWLELLLRGGLVVVRRYGQYFDLVHFKSGPEEFRRTRHARGRGVDVDAAHDGGWFVFVLLLDDDLVAPDLIPVSWWICNQELLDDEVGRVHHRQVVIIIVIIVSVPDSGPCSVSVLENNDRPQWLSV